MDFHETLYVRIFQKSDKKSQVTLQMTRITGTSHEGMYISHSWLLRMRNDSAKFVERKKILILSKKKVISMMGGGGMMEPDRPQVTI